MEFEQTQILLVEDEEYDIELTLTALKSHKVANQIYVARDGAEALRFLADCEARQAAGTGLLPKLVLLDLNLPKVNGIEVLERIKSNPMTKIIPVVVLTSSTDDQEVRKTYLHGANSYLQKPVKFDEFCDVVKEVGLYWLLMNRLPLAGPAALPNLLEQQTRPHE